MRDEVPILPDPRDFLVPRDFVRDGFERLKRLNAQTGFTFHGLEDGWTPLDVDADGCWVQCPCGHFWWVARNGLLGRKLFCPQCGKSE